VQVRAWPSAYTVTQTVTIVMNDDRDDDDDHADAVCR